MKAKISVAIDQEHLDGLNELVQTGRFRNKSHVIDYALAKLLEGDDSHEYAPAPRQTGAHDVLS